MFVRTFRKLWMHLLIAFYDNYTSEGFERTKNKFDLPENLSQLDPLTKRKFTICNLFANQNLSIKDICVVLDAGQHQVVDALIDNGLIKERRRKNRAKKKGSLSITPDETTRESSNPNSGQDPQDSGQGRRIA